MRAGRRNGHATSSSPQVALCQDDQGFQHHVWIERRPTFATDDQGPLHLGAVEFQLPQGANGYFSQIADTLNPAHHSVGQPEQVRELPLGSEDRFSRDCLQGDRNPRPAMPYPAYLLPLRFPPSVAEPGVHADPERLFPFPTHSNFASSMIACERSLGSPWPCGYRHRKSSIASI